MFKVEFIPTGKIYVAVDTSSYVDYSGDYIIKFLVYMNNEWKWLDSKYFKPAGV